MSTIEVERVKDAYHLESFIPGLKKAGRLYKMCCPFHAEQTPSFTVDPETQQWRCYGACQTGGDILSYAMKSNGWTFYEALKELAERAGVRLEKRAPKENASTTRLYALLKDAAAFYAHELLYTDDAIPAMDYLINERGLNVADIEIWELGYAPQRKDASYSHLKKLGYTEQEMIAAGVRGQNDETKQTYERFRHRLMFPIHDPKGRVTGFSARRMPDAGPKEAKYINSKQSDIFTKSSLLYGLKSRVKNSHSGALEGFQVTTIVEGNMDVIRAHKRGFTDVCAPMGTALTDKHLQALKEHGIRTVILCLDSDASGQDAMHDRARQMIIDSTAFRLGLDIKIASLGDYKDPDELIRADPHLWEEAMFNARPAVDVLISREVSKLPPNASVIQRTEVAKSLMDILRSPDSPMQTVENTRKLAMALSLPSSVFVEWSTTLRVLPKTAPASAVRELRGEPPTETALLWGIIANASDYWLMRANAALDCLSSVAMPYALAPLSSLDFSYDLYRHLFETFLDHEIDLESHVSGTPLEEVYDRVVNQPFVIGRFIADTPQNQPRDTYEEFLKNVFEIRMMRLNEDMELFNQMGDMDRFREAMRGVALLQKTLQKRA